MDPEEKLDNRDVSLRDEVQESLNSSGYPVLQSQSWGEDSESRSGGQASSSEDQPTTVTRSAHFVELEEEKDGGEQSGETEGDEEEGEEDEDDREDQELLSELR